jgi:tetratricopeptide (TPR) repeat protein
MSLKKSLMLLIMFGMFSGASAAEKPAAEKSPAEKPVVRVADYYYKQFDYIKAIAFYKRALKKDQKDVHVLQKLADSYRLINDWPNAETYYAQLVTMENSDVTDKLYYAEALRADQKYADAKTYYQAYADAAPNDPSVKDRIASLDQIDELSKDHGFYDIKDLDINSKYSDFGVSLYKDTGILFCSNRYEEAVIKHKDDWTHASFLQIYEALKDDTSGKITKATLLHGHQPNGKFHEGVTSYNDKLQELYLDRSNYNGKRAFFAADKTVKLKIYRIAWLPDQNRFGDETVEAVPFNDKEYSVCHPSISKDGKTLYFASDKPG